MLLPRNVALFFIVSFLLSFEKFSNQESVVARNYHTGIEKKNNAHIVLAEKKYLYLFFIHQEGILIASTYG